MTSYRYTEFPQVPQIYQIVGQGNTHRRIQNNSITMNQIFSTGFCRGKVPPQTYSKITNKRFYRLNLNTHCHFICATTYPLKNMLSLLPANQKCETLSLIFALHFFKVKQKSLNGKPVMYLQMLKNQAKLCNSKIPIV